MAIKTLEKPEKIKGITWFLFGGAATFCAFFLPITIILHFKTYNQYNLIFLILNFSVILLALYHSFYRIKASNHDLKLGRSFIIWISAITILTLVIENV